ncbi:1-aminocyclopropane-1-carboxylate deaminase [Robiginitalea myxolifaciens]|uniref:1-aminocyclopropane-1-carboxylate deaminase n=1 Tax=Robiginitalea myxolifaciens TaxID=400055 RepID=A0A1I6GD56_9FLAO|nr:pyridoxal-phosphate dependent enzyme [Robiginitalea myxolifaciens]SFR40078.1 1-aminocyclopropane-1-carboxylate deaminase [Robiginitalea myxolifaciens]
MTGSPHNPRTDRLVLSALRDFEITLDLRREDLFFPGLSGNKYRKLKYNLAQAREEGARQLLTFGGAYSNHIHATAAVGKAFGFETVGLIRGEELATQPLNPTLAEAQEMGMQLVFTSRQDYSRRHEPEYLEVLAKDYPDTYIIPEGGTNALAIKGCSEILQPGDAHYDLVCCPVGTGGTMLGLRETGMLPVWGYAALKGLSDSDASLTGPEATLRTGYHFGGYGKITEELAAFIRTVYEETGVVLDGVYTGKMLFGICADIRGGVIPPGSGILAIHTGGVQGNRGLNAGLQKKGLTLLPL